MNRASLQAVRRGEQSVIGVRALRRELAALQVAQPRVHASTPETQAARAPRCRTPALLRRRSAAVKSNGSAKKMVSALL